MLKPTRKNDISAGDDTNTANERAGIKSVVNTSTNEPAPRPMGCITSIRSKDLGSKSINIPYTVLERDIGVIRNTVAWPVSHNVDLGALLIGAFFAVDLPDGGPTRANDGDEPGAGDLNLYKPITRADGKVTLAMQEIGYNTIGADENTPFDINRVRGIALRLPVMAKGWGFDVNGNKLVSEEDKLNMDKWLSGPIDLRYRCDTKTWVSSATAVDMQPHAHLDSGIGLSGGGISYSSFFPSDLPDSESFKGLCLPKSDT